MNKIPSPVSFVLTIVFIIIMVVIGVIVFSKKEVVPVERLPVVNMTPNPAPCITSDCQKGA